MACKQFLQKCWATTVSKGGHDANVLSNLQIISARPGYIKTALPVEKRHLNNHKTVHGGVILGNLTEQLTDTVTSLALSTMGIAAPTGVSVNISTEFVRPGGREGDDLYGVGEVTKLGKTLAYTRITFYDAQDRVVAYGSHTKHMGSNQPSIAFSADGENEVPFEPRAKL